MFRNKSASAHSFAMVPSSMVPRSVFRSTAALKTTFNSGYLVPFLCEEVVPGDTFKARCTLFARLATPIFPFMDNMRLETFFFFVPNRIVWQNWVKLMGEQLNPGDSISYSVPQIVSPAGGYAVNSLFDYFGLPTVGQVTAGQTITHSGLPFRAYNMIWNQWFRDQNLQNAQTVYLGDAPDVYTNYSLLRRGKRHDYFTSCLPFLQKGPAVTMNLGTSAPVRTQVGASVTGAQAALKWTDIAGTGTNVGPLVNDPVNGTRIGTLATGAVQNTVYPNNLIADLTAATAATINSLRLSIAIQKLLEKDARGGTRYNEIVFNQFRVSTGDARVQRPEYLGGGSSPISVNPIAQTSGTAASGTTTPLGNLAAVGTAVAGNHGFSQSFLEHGYVIGLLNVRADLTYQQGLRRHWSRLTRYDFYTPNLAELGEQAVLNKEIYSRGDANDDAVFGYQERWAEYRYGVSQITGLMRSTAAGTLDAWHLSQRFTSLPTLNSTFIQDTPPVSRVIAVPSQPEFLLDGFLDITMARPMPTYSVPGLGDRF